MNKKLKQLRRFEDGLMEKLSDFKYAEGYLKIALEEFEGDGDTEAFLQALKDVAMAQGGMSKVAKQSHLNRSNLYRALSPKGNPRLYTVGTILNGLGYRLSVEAIQR